MSEREELLHNILCKNLKIKYNDYVFILVLLTPRTLYMMYTQKRNGENVVKIYKEENCWYINGHRWWYKTKLGYGETFPDFGFFHSEIIGLNKVIIKYFNLLNDFIKSEMSVEDFNETLKEINSTKL